MSNNNSVALLIPHYNNYEGLLRSVKSIKETEEIDVVIVDDGSTENLITEKELIDSFKAKGKIIFMYLDYNKGIEYALNYGIEYIVKNKYQFTARLDAGDICIGSRFEIQKKFLLKNNDIKLLGTNAIAKDVNGNYLFKYNFPTCQSLIKKKIFLNAVFVHPTIMFDNEILEKIGNYPLIYKAAEDYGFTFKVVNHFKTANLKEALIEVEINPKGISLTKRKTQIKSRIKVIRDNFRFGFYPIFGLCKNITLLLMPDKIIFFLKRIFVNK